MKNNTSEIIGIIVSLSGLTVMAGWILDIGVFKSILPCFVTMKFSTALCFFLGGIELFYIARYRKREMDIAGVVIPIASVMIFLMMATLFASTVLGTDTGVEELFVKESMTAVRSVSPGRPAIPTMLNFIIIAIAGNIVMLNARSSARVLAIMGSIVGVVGAVALTGYLLNKPMLTFAFTGISSAMAMHTAILFLLWGTGAIMVGNNSGKQKEKTCALTPD
ncbi:MAG: hypothetical protein HQL30_11445 [Candidatus Omnitrophica bacterium]|nr:hypothetical protein [Candidatus Omnitrophota bacterium]